MNIIHSTDGAFVYHDGFTIRGIHFAADDDLALKFESFQIDKQIAQQFIDDELNVRDWFVWRGTTGVALYKKSNSLGLSFIDDLPVLLPETAGWFTLNLYRSGYVVFHLNAPMAFETPEAELPFVFTEKGDPSAVLLSLAVPTAELLKDQSLEMALPIDLGKPVDIYTRRLFPSYGIKWCRDDEEMVISLPKGHFIDIMRFERGMVTRGLQAVLNRSEGILRLMLVGGGIVTYNRPMPFLRLLFTMPGDPSLILHTEVVPIEKLKHGCWDIQLPDIQYPFDLWSPLLYREAALELLVE